MLRASLLTTACLLSAVTLAPVQAQEVSVSAGERISIIGGCHDCHSPGYAESNGKIDPATALTGNPVGYSGPWGTTYAMNLRLVAADQTEDEWVKYLSSFEARPPMPWFNVHAFTEAEMRSLYQYIKSLGDPGQPTPEALPPGETPKTPYVVMAPPSMPSG